MSFQSVKKKIFYMIWIYPVALLQYFYVTPYCYPILNDDEQMWITDTTYEGIEDAFC